MCTCSSSETVRVGSVCTERRRYSRRVDISGTFISLYKKSSDGKVLATPIFERLRNQSTLLRKSNDPSLLLHAMLDLSRFLPALSYFIFPTLFNTVVDKALEIVDRYQDQILELEQSVLLQPKMKTVRACAFYLSGTVILLFSGLLKCLQSAYSRRRPYTPQADTDPHQESGLRHAAL